MSFVERTIVLDPGEGKVSPIPGTGLTLKLASRDTEGAFGLVELTLDGEGPPPHIHHGEDETFYILEGEVNFTVGSRTIKATKGSVVLGPKDVAHSFSMAGPEPAKILVIFTPGGLEQLFIDVMAAPIPTTKEEYINRMISLAGKYNVELLPPPAG